MSRVKAVGPQAVAWQRLIYFKVRYMDDTHPHGEWPLFRNGNQRIRVKISFLAVDAANNPVEIPAAQVHANLTLVNYEGGTAPIHVGPAFVDGWSATIDGPSQGRFQYSEGFIRQTSIPGRVGDVDIQPLPPGYLHNIVDQEMQAGSEQIGRLEALKAALGTQGIPGPDTAERLDQVQAELAGTNSRLLELQPLSDVKADEPVEAETYRLNGIDYALQGHILHVATTSTTSRTLAARFVNGNISFITNTHTVSDPVGEGVGGKFNSSVKIIPYAPLNPPRAAYGVEEVSMGNDTYQTYISCIVQGQEVKFLSMVYEGSINWSITRHNGEFNNWEWGFTFCGQPGSTIRGQNMQPYLCRAGSTAYRNIYDYMAYSIKSPREGQPVIAERLGKDHSRFYWAKGGDPAEYPTKNLEVVDVHGNVHRLRAHFQGERGFQFVYIDKY